MTEIKRESTDCAKTTSIVAHMVLLLKDRIAVHCIVYLYPVGLIPGPL